MPDLQCRGSAIGETPSRSAKPATLRRNLLIAVEPRDPLPTSARERVCRRAFGNLITAAGTRKDRDRRNPAREIILTVALDPKTAPALAIRSGDFFAAKPWSDVIGRISRPPSARRSSQL